MKVELLHYSNQKGAEGVPGDIFDVPQEVAQQWIASKGARPVSGDAELTTATKPPLTKATETESKKRVKKKDE